MPHPDALAATTVKPEQNARRAVPCLRGPRRLAGISGAFGCNIIYRRSAFSAPRAPRPAARGGSKKNSRLRWLLDPDGSNLKAAANPSRFSPS